jgi:hypothetical protein
VGLQGLAVGERSTQQALAYANERVQGQALGGAVGSSSAIVEHPDVRRMLLMMLTSIDAMRSLLYATAVAGDLARHHPDPLRREAERARVDLLTPLAKAWCTDEGVRLSSLAVQVHGGAGYIEETGVAQRYRDARIPPIYEGTNGIQAIDLVNRKVVRDGGEALHQVLSELSIQPRLTERVSPVHGILRRATEATEQATSWLLWASDEDRLAGATPYLEMVALTVVGGLLARQVDWAMDHEPADVAATLAGRLSFFAVERLAAVPALWVAATAGSRRLDTGLLG